MEKENLTITHGQPEKPPGVSSYFDNPDFGTISKVVDYVQPR